MFIRKKKNKSGSHSVQIISKARGKYKVITTIGSGKTEQELQKLVFLAKEELDRLKAQSKLFVSEKDVSIEAIFSTLSNSSIQTVGPELIFGKIYNHIGFNQIQEDLFRHLVISRLAFPLSKLKTVDYLFRYQGINLSVTTVYRFLDKLNERLKKQVEQISFKHTKKILGGKVNVVFYDMTTIYFEASAEDELRKTGFSKDGKHSNPQIFLGLLVGLGGYAIGYDIFEGNIYEGHTLIPFLKKISEKFDLNKPIVVADAGLLSNNNIKALEEAEYEYILGARIKSETDQIKKKILAKSFKNGQLRSIAKADGLRLIISYSNNRADKDEYNRKRGLLRLNKRIKSGKLTKTNINNRGYNKYLKMDGEIIIELDEEKIKQDKKWDGLKGYVTNTKLTKKQIVDHYSNLWHIEKAFRMSKTDLRIRPIYHRLKHRIEAHICISFAAYSIYKELERVLYKEKSAITIERSADLTHNMYQINYTLPESKQSKSKLLKMDDEQAELYRIIRKYF
jgi:transposase